MASIIITSLTPNAGTILSNVPFGQDTTFSVVASADFSTATYEYQWKKDSIAISDATNSVYTFDALSTTLGAYSVSVSALSAGVSQAVVSSGNIELSSVAEDTVKPFDVYDRGTESGRERHRRMHHLGYI
jgi:hypothetical protein